MLIASIILKNPLSLNRIGQAVIELSKIQAQQCDLEQYDPILRNGSLIMVDQNLFGLVVFLEGFIFLIDLEVDVPQLIVLIGNRQRPGT